MRTVETKAQSRGEWSEVRYLDLDRPAEGEAVEVAPGIHWLRLPLPFALNHVNVWLLADGDGWTIVDTGISSERMRELWRQAFDGVMAGLPVKRVICTHFHPDHAGLAGWLCGISGAPLFMTRTEWLMARLLTSDTGEEMSEAIAAFYARAGATEGYLDYLRDGGPGYPKIVCPPPRGYCRLVDGDSITIGCRQWTVIVGEGHSPEHACLYCAEDGVLIGGDQVLPRISPNVAVHAPDPEADPLGDFLRTLERLREVVPEDVTVLPSHDAPYTGLHARLDELAAHHDERLQRLLESLDGGAKTAMDVARVLFDRPLDNHQTGFAIGETLAHLNRLRATGEVERSSDADGLWWYRRTGGGDGARERRNGIS